MIRRASRRVCTWAALPSGRLEHAGDVLPELRRHPVGRPAGHGVQRVPYVEQCHPAALQVAVGYVDQPARHQRLEHGGVAQPADRLLQVGDGRVRQLAGLATPLGDQLAQLLEPGAGVATPLVQHGGAQPQGQVGVTGQVAGVEHPGRHPEVRGSLVEHLLDAAHRVVDVRAGVPERVPDLARPLPHLDLVVVHEHDVEVAERRQLLAAVAAHRHQGHTRLGAARSLERIGTQPVGRTRAFRALGGGHGCSAGLRQRTRRGRRCGPARRSRSGRPTPCRRRCGRWRPRPRSPR